MIRRATIAVALIAALAWCCLLFGIGLDDLTDGDSKPGVVFSIVVLTVLIGGLVYGVWRLVRVYLLKRVARR